MWRQALAASIRLPIILARPELDSMPEPGTDQAAWEQLWSGFRGQWAALLMLVKKRAAEGADAVAAGMKALTGHVHWGVVYQLLWGRFSLPGL